MAIGNYVHLEYDHYLQYSLNTMQSGQKHSVTEADVQRIFEEQTEMIHTQMKARQKRLALNVAEIEQQLNFYYDARKGTADEKLNSEITDEDLKHMQESIAEFLGAKMNKVSIDYDTLSSSVVSGDFNAGVLEAKGEYKEDLLAQLKGYSNKSLGKGEKVNRKAVEDRIQLLLKVRERLAKEDKINSKELRANIRALNTEWNYLKRLLDSHTKEGRNRLSVAEGSRAQKFINELNDMMSSFLSGSSTLHGEYAEAVIVATNYLANAKAHQGTGDIMGGLQRILQNSVKGQSSSAKGLLRANFDIDYVDLRQVVENTVYDSLKSIDSEGNIFSTRITPDKVDVEITVNGLQVPASVKNYNMGNPSTDIHLLSGRSVLALVQEYDNFVNHYLNITAEHDDFEPSGGLLNAAAVAMKLTVLLKAIAGGVASRSADGQIGMSQEADLFIINDNSVGRFRVYLIDDILNAVQANIDLLKTGGLDHLSKLSNTYVGSRGDLNMGDARMRISNLLAQLHQMELQVSIGKQVFSQI